MNSATSLSDTIAAIATPPGTGGIGIIRLSGKNALAVCDKLFSGKKQEPLSKKKSHTISYGWCIDPANGQMVDEILLAVMRAPNTYTREDLCEMQCHGGQAVMQRILELCLQHGARLAEPGEFTKRAFLNGRIDLTQAEAVMDLVQAKTEMARKTALQQLSGGLRKKIHSLREQILDMIASIEAAIDYPEHDIEEETYESIRIQCCLLLEQIKKLLSTAEQGRMIRDGIQTVILGKPNAGKSSLLNLLLQEERAIVTEIAGTTRDALEEYMNLSGIPFKIVDTAGIRTTGDLVEQIGVQKAKEYALDADLILLLLDSSRPIEQEDLDILSLIEKKRALVLVNKIDLEQKMDMEQLYQRVDPSCILSISVTEEKGMELLKEKMLQLFFDGEIQLADPVVIQNTRQKQALQKTAEALEKTLQTIALGMPEDFISIDLQDALSALSELTGDQIDDEIIDRIFTKFCLGK